MNIDLTLYLELVEAEYKVDLMEGHPADVAGQNPEFSTKDALEDLKKRLRELKTWRDQSLGREIFDWIFAQEKLRRQFLERCEAAAGAGEQVRLWVVFGPRLCGDNSFVGFQAIEKDLLVSWEGLWISEWKNEAKRPRGITSPFLALNTWATIIRWSTPDFELKPSGNKPIVEGQINVLLITSNPPEKGISVMGVLWEHIKGLDDMRDAIWGALQQHHYLGWVGQLNNPSPARISATIREHRPHLIFYIGHGYAGAGKAGLTLAVQKDMVFLGGVRPIPDECSELEQVLLGAYPEGDALKGHERARLVVLLSCEAAQAGPALFQNGIPAVLAMRKKIYDDHETVEMIEKWLAALVEEGKPLDTSLGDLRRGMQGVIHWSVPMLYLGKEAVLFPSTKEYARGQYFRLMRARCSRYARSFDQSAMNEVSERTYVNQTLSERVKRETRTPEGDRRTEWVEEQREFWEALQKHRQVVLVGRAGRGKTSRLYWAVLSNLRRLEESGEQARLPLLIPLRDLARAGNFQKWLKGQLPEEPVRNWLYERLENEPVLLLLDALDEVDYARRQELLERQLVDLLGQVKNRGSRTVLTCRDNIYPSVSRALERTKMSGNGEGFVQMDLKPFEQKEITEYTNRYFRDDPEEPKSFLEGLTDPRVKHLAQEPLHLHMLCWLWATRE